MNEQDSEIDDEDDEVCQELWLMRRMLALQFAQNDRRKLALSEKVGAIPSVQSVEQKRTEMSAVEAQYLKFYPVKTREEREASDDTNFSDIDADAAGLESEADSDGAYPRSKYMSHIKPPQRRYEVKEIDISRGIIRLERVRLRRRRRTSQHVCLV